MKKKANILVVDDNEEILVALRLFLSGHFEKVFTLKNPELISGVMMKENLDVIILDMNFKAGINTGNEGIFWMNKILTLDPAVSVVFITAYSGIELAVNAIKQGATDFIEKPWDDDKLLASVLKACETHRAKLEISNLKEKQKHLSERIDTQYDFFMGASPAMDKIYKTIDKVAATDASVLILGENGTGKEIIAREIHRRSKRSKEVFIGVDLGALAETLFESELFGHVKGAFTDARDDRPGRVEISSGGTLFLDEIGNLPFSLQAKLLTVIQNREVTRLGTNRSIAVDLRLITATNRPVYQMAEQNSFREDLLYRINTIQIDLPPLRERKEDILPLTQYFVAKYAAKYEKSLAGMDKSTKDRLLSYNWPGNIRELQHMAEKAVIMCDGNRLTTEDFFYGARTRTPIPLNEILNLEQLEKESISRAVEKCRGNVTQAVKELGISRRAFYYKLKKYDL
jgi:two-component system response regulator HydG